MAKWDIKKLTREPTLHDPVLVEGLPGIGNVGKIVADFLVEELKAEKLYEIYSTSFPNSVFINEKSLVELPKISIYFLKQENKKKGGGKKKVKQKRDLLFLVGDIQPTEEEPSYEFADYVLKLIKELGCREVITMGGIGLKKAPSKPVIYITGNSRSLVEKYMKGTKMSDEIFGRVGPIIGATGLLVGLAGKHRIEAISLLAETMGHPLYLGVNGAKEILKVLKKRLEIAVSIGRLDSEMKEVEDELLKRTKELQKVAKRAMEKESGKVSYIG